ncbi:MAG TPA: potassium channel family protein [Gemmatimonadales bacterium]|nr:potassium channel family protein [Gemmatimonadales bacterium]HRZ09294.1 potassium channel family protein [Gemmatimonadales bacterium]
MTFVLDFIEIYARGLFYLWPIFAVLIGFIAALGLRIGALEGWEPHEAVYFAFITATTINFGDRRPTMRRSRWLALVIALAGVLLTGLIVSIGLEAVAHAFRESRGGAPPLSP